jgi:hypothetical protein
MKNTMNTSKHFGKSISCFGTLNYQLSRIDVFLKMFATIFALLKA